MKLLTSLCITENEGKGKKIRIMLRREKNCIAEGEGSLEVCLEPTRPDFQYYKGNNV